MKRIIAMAAAIIFTTGLSAFAENGETTHKTNYQLTFASLRVENDIDIVLTEDEDKSIEFTGTDVNISKVDWKIKNGVLTLKSKKGSLKGKVKVRISVSHLQEISIAGASDVSSKGRLNSNRLKIAIEGEAYISIKNNGAINVVNEDGIELEVRKMAGAIRFN